MIQDWETIGIREGWLENGWTEEQMMARIQELNLPPPPYCALQPYYLNYMQQPNMNEIILKIRDETKKLTTDDSSWIAASNLWTPGQTINIVFSNSQNQEFIKACLLKYLQPNVSMKLNFPGGTSGDIIVNVTSLSGQGGNSAVGKQGRQQTVNLNGSSLSGADVNRLTGEGGGGKGTFYWPRYLVCHEFGHAMGLWHEWNREMCGRNITCSAAQDSYSVMNYPSGSSGGASDAKPSPNCMDTYSPEDIKWLQTVYKGGQGSGTGTGSGTGSSTDTGTGTIGTGVTPQKPPQTQKPKPQPKPQPKPNKKKAPKKQFDIVQISPQPPYINNVYIYILLTLVIICTCILVICNKI